MTFVWVWLGVIAVLIACGMAELLDLTPARLRARRRERRERELLDRAERIRQLERELGIGTDD